MDTEEVVEKKLVKNIFCGKDIDPKTSESKIVSILLSDMNYVKKFFNEKIIDKYNFSPMFHNILECIEIQFKNNCLLTRAAFQKINSNKQNTKIIRIGEEEKHNRLSSNQVDFTMYTEFVNDLLENAKTNNLSTLILSTKSYFTNKNSSNLLVKLSKIEKMITDKSITVDEGCNQVQYILDGLKADKEEKELNELEEESYNKEQQNISEYRLEDHPIDIKHFPEVFRDMIVSFRENLYSTNDCVVFASCLGALLPIIGKKVFTVNEKTIYPNMGSIVLVKTGGGKTAAYELVKNTVGKLSGSLVLPDTFTIEGLKDFLGTVIPKVEFTQLKSIRNTITGVTGLDEKLQSIKDEAEKDLTGKSWISDEATNTLEQILGAYDSKSPNRNLGSVLKLFDSGSVLDSVTRGGGVTVCPDLCISFLGFSQDGMWNLKFGQDLFKMSGLAGRFLPFTENLKFTGMEKKDKEVLKDGIEPKDVFKQKLNMFYQIVQAMPRVECIIQNNEDDDKNVDYIGQAKKLFLETTLAKVFKKNYPNDFDNLINKFITFGIKLSQVFTLLDKLDSIKSKLNTMTGVKKIYCNLDNYQYCIELTAKIFYSYLEQVKEVSELGQLVNKITDLLRKESLTYTEITRSVSSRSLGLVKEAIEVGLEDKCFKEILVKPDKGRRVTMYRITQQKESKIK